MFRDPYPVPIVMSALPLVYRPGIFIHNLQVERRVCFSGQIFHSTADDSFEMAALLDCPPRISCSISTLMPDSVLL